LAKKSPSKYVEALALQPGERRVVAHAGSHEQRALNTRRLERHGQLVVRPPRHVDLHDRAQRHQLLDVVPAVVVVQGQRVAGAGELLQQRQQVVRGRIGLDLHHRAVRAHRRRPDLHQEVAGDRDPRGMAAGQPLEADVAERLDEQCGRRLGVLRRIAEVHRAPEAQLVADDVVARVGDRMAYDSDLRPPKGCAHTFQCRPSRPTVEGE